MKKLKFVVFSVLLVVAFIVVSDCFSYQVGPVRIHMDVARGKTETALLVLVGDAQNEKVLLYLTDIISDRKGNYQFERMEDWKYSAFSWLKLYKVMKIEEKTPEGKVKPRILSPLYEERETITLGKDKEAYIGIKVEVPYKAKPGQYYAGIMVEPTEFTLIRGEIEGRKVLIRKKTRVAVPIIIDVPGAIPKKDGKVISLNANVKKEEIKILVTFENRGNVLEYVKGKAQIVNKANGRVYDVVTMKALNPSSPDGTGEIYPETLRDFEGVIKRPLPIGDYEVRVAFDYGIKLREARMTTSFSVSEAVAVEQKELLVLVVEPEFLELTLPRGGRMIKGLKVTNLYFEPLEVKVTCNEWLNVTPVEFTISPERSENLRVVVTIPPDEELRRIGKILFKPEKGKPVSVDVVINPEEGE